MKATELIKPLNNGFGNQVVGLILPIQQEEFNVAITVNDQPDLLDIETYYQQPGGNFWGAFHQDELVGTIALIAIGHQAGAIRKMFVKQEFRGKEKSIAQQLLNQLMAYCEAKNITDIYLGTIAQMNAAQRFYERNGFQQIEAADLPSYFPRMQVDNLFYHLDLKKQA
ncbi:GNAT family N-acetyltransferase [Pedobacter sp. KR3-3]|uniref:GNAT family N-acetyltransferase n=1 Tax=Pedobacter albus TaxID=3113905 RepID=A0ABU7ICI9_9SPHI|nr:GNAT family N-acetyltransferase [Pedobacter sp. KR3-3]MEE1946991.1 GNAT family N-acetyltransferase [Pedobacter sp. KR3-3]